MAVCRNRSNLKDLSLRFSEKLVIVEADVASEAGRAHLCDTINDVDKIDYILHCVAVATPLGKLKNIDYQEWKI